MAAREWWSPEEIRAFQWGALQESVRFAWEHNPYYRGLWSRHGVSPEVLRTLEDFRRFPIVEKADLRAALQAGTAHSTGVGSSPIWLSSTGSTGEPFRFPLDRPSARLRRALTFRAREAAGHYDGDRNCKLWRTQAHEPLGERLRKRWLHRQLELSVYDDENPKESYLDDTKLAAMCERIRSFKPRVIDGYVSALRLLAQYIVTRHENGLTPRAVVTGGEVLDAPTRELIAAAFRCTVFDRYGGTEAGLIAHECGHDPAHRLHLQADAVYVETVRGDEPVASGERGELIVTSFHSRALPLIRYRLGDVARLEPNGERCRCGRGLPLLSHIEGRVNDLFLLPGGRTLSSHVFHKVFRDARSVRAFQVVQSGENTFEVRIESVGGSVAEPELAALRRKVAAYLPGAAIDWRFVPRLEPGPGGKLRQCVRLFERPPGAPAVNDVRWVDRARGEYRESA
jgi:phenylacetate-CoA ligase